MKKPVYILITLLVLVLVSVNVNAQDGLAPLVNSTHNYSVTPGNATDNALSWTVTGGTAPTDFEILSGANTEEVTILWKTAKTYILQFTETNEMTTCSTIKQKSIEVGDNTFDINTPATLANLCNEASGVPNYSLGTVATTISFVVNMATGKSTWNPDWEFEFTLTPSTDALISNVSASTGTLSGSGPYIVTGIGSTGGQGTVTITLDLTGDVYSENSVDFTITSAEELQYNTPDVDTDDYSVTQIINAIPSTTSISVN